MYQASSQASASRCPPDLRGGEAIPTFPGTVCLCPTASRVRSGPEDKDPKFEIKGPDKSASQLAAKQMVPRC